jgi:hypothetical protein
MAAFIDNVTFDAREPRALGRFWSDVTNYPTALRDAEADADTPVWRQQASGRLRVRIDR